MLRRISQLSKRIPVHRGFSKNTFNDDDFENIIGERPIENNTEEEADETTIRKTPLNFPIRPKPSIKRTSKFFTTHQRKAFEQDNKEPKEIAKDIGVFASLLRRTSDAIIEQEHDEELMESNEFYRSYIDLTVSGMMEEEIASVLKGIIYNPFNHYSLLADNISNLKIIIKASLRNGETKLMDNKDIRHIIGNKKLEKLMKIVLDYDFYSRSPRFLNSSNAAKIIERVITEREGFDLVPLLSLSLHEKAQGKYNFSQSYQTFLSRCEENQGLDMLHCFHAIAGFTRTEHIKDSLVSYFSKYIRSLSLGTSIYAPNKDLSNNITKVLDGFELNTRQLVLEYLLDSFLNSGGYLDSLRVLLLNLIILSRVQNGHSTISKPLGEIKRTSSEVWTFTQSNLPFILDKLGRDELSAMIGSVEVPSQGSVKEPLDTSYFETAWKDFEKIVIFSTTTRNTEPKLVARMRSYQLNVTLALFEATQTKERNCTLAKELFIEQVDGFFEEPSLLSLKEIQNALTKIRNSNTWLNEKRKGRISSQNSTNTSLRRAFSSTQGLDDEVNLDELIRNDNADSLIDDILGDDFMNSIDDIIATNKSEDLLSIDELQVAVDSNNEKHRDLATKIADLSASSAPDVYQQAQSLLKDHVNSLDQILPLLFEHKQMEEYISAVSLLHYLFNYRDTKELEFDEETVRPDPESMLQIDDKMTGFEATNYSKYLVQNFLQVDLGVKAYIALVTYHIRHFKKVQFKRIMAHYLLYSPTINTSVLDAMCEVASRESLGQELCEFLYLAIHTGKPLSNGIISRLILRSEEFKGLIYNIFEVMKAYIQKTHSFITYPMLQDLFNKYLSVDGKIDNVMFMFDRFREITEKSFYQFSNELSDADNFAANQKFEEEKEESLRLLFQDYIEHLISKNFTKECYFMYSFIKENNWLKTDKDYINGFLIYKEDPSEFLGIYEHMKANIEFQMSNATISKVLIVMKDNAMALSSIFEDILETLIFQQRVELDTDLQRNILLMFKKVNYEALLTKFVDFIESNKIPVHFKTKITFFEVFRGVSNEELRNKLFGIVRGFGEEQKQHKTDQRKDNKESDDKQRQQNKRRELINLEREERFTSMLPNQGKTQEEIDQGVQRQNLSKLSKKKSGWKIKRNKFNAMRNLYKEKHGEEGYLLTGMADMPL